MAATRIDVVVPMRNKRALLPQALGSIVDAARRHGAANLVIVDNGSSDGSLEFVQNNYLQDAVLIECPPNVTIGGVRNLGASRGSAPIIVFLDCDCLVSPRHLLQVETVLREHDSAVAVGCKIALPPSPTWVEKAWNDLHDDGGDGERGYINSSNLSVRRQAFIACGAFSETLETGEDSELCQRLRRSGGKVLQDQRLSVMHLDNAKTLPAFFSKERWRGLGMFGTVSLTAIDKPTAMMFLHLLLVLTAAWLTISNGLKPAALLLVAASILAVPFISVVYRRRRALSAPGWLVSILLYEVYFAARIAALAILAWRLVAPNRRHQTGQRPRPELPAP